MIQLQPGLWSCLVFTSQGYRAEHCGGAPGTRRLSPSLLFSCLGFREQQPILSGTQQTAQHSTGPGAGQDGSWTRCIILPVHLRVVQCCSRGRAVPGDKIITSPGQPGPSFCRPGRGSATAATTDILSGTPGVQLPTLYPSPRPPLIDVDFSGYRLHPTIQMGCI